jgi:hypothetical protein
MPTRNWRSEIYIPYSSNSIYFHHNEKTPTEATSLFCIGNVVQTFISLTLKRSASCNLNSLFQTVSSPSNNQALAVHSLHSFTFISCSRRRTHHRLPLFHLPLHLSSCISLPYQYASYSPLLTHSLPLHSFPHPIQDDCINERRYRYRYPNRRYFC